MPTECQATPSPLADDLLSGVAAIARHTGESERRVRHLIRAHGFPAFKRGGLLYSRKTWCDHYYSGQPGDTGGEK